MSEKNTRDVLEQVDGRLAEAWLAFKQGKYKEVDERLCLLRDVLDDIYDRPDEKLIELDPAAGQ